MPSYRPYETLPDSAERKNRLMVDPQALADNYLALAGHLPTGCAAFAVVKADAYGHTVEIAAPALYAAGCRHYAVSCISEALALRAALPSPEACTILILGYTPPESAPLLARYSITQCVFSLDYAKALSDATDGVIPIHVKLNTGMNRLGFDATDPSRADEVADEIAPLFSMPHLNVCGMFAHFAKADEFTEEGDAFTKRQFENFMAVDNALKARGLDVGFRHVANSAAAIRFPEYALDGVRYGIILYGAGDRRLSEIVPVRPAMKLITTVSQVHTVRAGQGVGYGSTDAADHDRKIVTIPIGYADGFIRAYKGATVTLVTPSGEHKIPLVGRVCMDQCMADATGVDDVKVGDRIRIFGGDRSELDALAERAGTIDYECLCLMTSRVPRMIEEY